MRRIIAVLMTLTILFHTTIGICELNWGTKSLNAGETAAVAFSLYVGEGNVLSLNKLASYDEIDSRFVLLNNKSLGSDLVVMIRISESEVYYWPLEMNLVNLVHAKIILDEDAPFCFVALYDDNEEVVDTATYIKSLSTLISYDSFMSDAEKLLYSFSLSDVKDNSALTDPFLTVFPEARWGMSQEDMKKKYGADQFFGSGDQLLSVKNDGINDINYSFVFENNKLKQIMIFVSGEEGTDYQNLLSAKYGNPIKTSLGMALAGIMVESENGDTYVWNAGNTYICMTSYMYIYMPVSGNDDAQIIQSNALIENGGDAEATFFTEDRILALFPGIGWGKSPEEMIRLYGDDLLTEYAGDPDDQSLYLQTMDPMAIDGEEARFLFQFYQEQLILIVAVTTENVMNNYISDNTSKYGEPIKTSFDRAINGDFTAVENGDCYVWVIGDNEVIVELNKYVVYYSPSTYDDFEFSD